MTAFLNFPFCHRFEFQRADGCQDEKLEGRRKNYEVRSKKKTLRRKAEGRKRKVRSKKGNERI